MFKAFATGIICLEERKTKLLHVKCFVFYLFQYILGSVNPLNKECHQYK